ESLVETLSRPFWDPSYSSSDQRKAKSITEYGAGRTIGETTQNMSVLRPHRRPRRDPLLTTPAYRLISRVIWRLEDGRSTNRCGASAQVLAMPLYRPVGEAELRLIARTGFREFPPRLPHQPIFYPVLDRDYAVQIARDWNTKDDASGFAGWVTEFEIDDQFAAKYPVRTAGARQHRELWVPAEHLAEFNRHIVGPIRVVDVFLGDRFSGRLDPATKLPLGLQERAAD